MGVTARIGIDQSLAGVGLETRPSQASSPDQQRRMSVPAIASAATRQSGVTSEALSILHSVFGLPGFRGAQEEIVRHVTAAAIAWC